MASVVIRYAKKPWDRGEPLTRTVEVPNGYTAEQADRWLWEKMLIKSGESVVLYTPNSVVCRKFPAISDTEDHNTVKERKG